MSPKFFALAGLVIVGLYIAGSGAFVSSSSAWYLSLTRPSWQPPDWVFGVIWPYNFAVLGVASWKIAYSANKIASSMWLLFLGASVTSALLWSYLFYQPHNLALAAFSLITAAVLTVPLTLIALRVSTMLRLALLPYQIWIVLAASLSTAINRLN